MQMPKIKKGSVADSLYLQFSEKKISHSVELTPDIVIDVAEDNTVVGFDIQYLTEVLEEGLLPTALATVQSPTVSLQLVEA